MFQLIDTHLPWLGDIIALGGSVLAVILLVAMLLWSLIIERAFYLWFVHPQRAKRVEEMWQTRSDHQSWYARQVRQRLISRVSMALETNLGLIKTLVALCPLLGLLGTVMGMMEVFDVMGATGSNSPRAMSAGVSKATLPTLAGMVTALSGVMVSHFLSNRAAYERDVLSEHLPLTDGETKHA